MVSLSASRDVYRGLRVVSRLFVSPTKPPTPEQKRVKPIDWLQGDLDLTGPPLNVETVARNLSLVSLSGLPSFSDPSGSTIEGSKTRTLTNETRPVVSMTEKMSMTESRLPEKLDDKPISASTPLKRDLTFTVGGSSGGGGGGIGMSVERFSPDLEEEELREFKEFEEQAELEEFAENEAALQREEEEAEEEEAVAAAAIVAKSSAAKKKTNGLNSTFVISKPGSAPALAATSTSTSTSTIPQIRKPPAIPGSKSRLSNFGFGSSLRRGGGEKLPAGLPVRTKTGSVVGGKLPGSKIPSGLPRSSSSAQTGLPRSSRRSSLPLNRDKDRGQEKKRSVC